MEGRRRPKKSLLMYDKVLFFSALILLAFTLIYALDYIISGAVIGNSDSFDTVGKVISMAKRLNIYFIFIVISFVTTTLALIYTILLKKRTYGQCAGHGCYTTIFKNKSCSN